MTPTRTNSTVSAGKAMGCDVAAYAVVQANADTLNSMRQTLDAPVGQALTPALLKHLDEQTLAGLAAIYQAIRAHNLQTTCFTDWGVLAAPRFLGRAALILSLQRYAVEGAWGMSPHFIPHRTLHSVAGTVSMALQIHGPNFGIDGGPAAASQGLLAAFSLLSDNQLPGVWLLLTGWDREPLPSKPAPATNGQPGHGHADVPSVCTAIALALVPGQPAWQGWRLHVHPPAMTLANGANGRGADRTLFSLEALPASLADEGLPASLGWRLHGGGWAELERVGNRDES